MLKFEKPKREKRSSLKKKCKELFKKIVRIKYGFNENDSSIDIHHVFPVGSHPHMEFTIDNGFPANRALHQRFHSDPKAANLWFIETFGEEKYNRLLNISSFKKQPPLQNVYEYLKIKYEELT